MSNQRASQRGVAVVVLLYGLTTFSVLSLTVLRNAELERTLRTADNPDLHVVLYAGGANSRTMVGRLNLPTALRNETGPEASTEVRIPGAPHLDLASELPQGWSYAVRLSANARVCCDGGDNACAGVTWDDEITSGTLAPAILAPLEPGGPARQLQFALSSLPVPRDVDLDATATAESAFLVRAARVKDGSGAAAQGAGDSQSMTCTLHSGEAEVAKALLRIQPGVDENRAVTRISRGTIELNYRATAGAKR